jgi:MFS family permease
MMHDIGFKTRPLKASRFVSEASSIFKAGVHYGWQNPAVRPLLLASVAQGSFFMYFFYASQPYALSLLGRPDLIWVSGVLAALFGLASIIGNLFVGLITRSRWGKSAPKVLTAGAVIFSILVGLAGLVGILAPQEGSINGFIILVVLLFLLGIWMGLTSPIRQGYINAHIPSQQRATVLSLDSFFNDAGSSIGQPSFGWLSRAISIPFAYVVGSFVTLIAAPFYKRSGEMADVCIDVGTAEEFCPASAREPIDSIGI